LRHIAPYCAILRHIAPYCAILRDERDSFQIKHLRRFFSQKVDQIRRGLAAKFKKFGPGQAGFVTLAR
jgi:hypothetical protein